MKRFISRLHRRKETTLHRPSFFLPRASVARRALAIGLVMTTGALVAPAAATASPRSWKSYVLGPASGQVRPVHAEGRGRVSHPGALVHGHGRRTTLTTAAGKTPASLVLDFGKDIAAPPHLDVAEVSGSATMSLVTGEARRFLRQPASTTTSAAA